MKKIIFQNVFSFLFQTFLSINMKNKKWKILNNINTQIVQRMSRMVECSYKFYFDDHI